MTRAALALGLLVLVPAAARAVPPGLEYAPPAPPPPPSATGLVLKLVGLTAVTVGLCAGVLWLARRAARPPEARGAAGRMALEGSLQLDRRCVLHLIRVDGQAVAVTTDATGLRALVLLSEPFGAALEAAGAPPADPA